LKYDDPSLQVRVLWWMIMSRSTLRLFNTGESTESADHRRGTGWNKRHPPSEALQPDLILLDIGLPGLNGIEVARRIGEVPPFTHYFPDSGSSVDIVREASTPAHGVM